MVKTRNFKAIHRPGSLRSASTSTQHADYPHAPVDCVALEAPCQLESVPSTEIDNRSGSNVIEQPPPQDCPSASMGERKVYWMVDVIGMINILNNMI